MKSKEYEYSGYITVFLSIILCVILALVATTIESARVSVAQVYMERVMRNAMQSTLAQFYNPLYENYHVFGLYCVENENQIDQKKLESEVMKYANYSFMPRKGEETGSILKGKNNNFLVCDPILDNVVITEKTTFLDYQGALFRKQAIEYTKYEQLSEGILSLLESKNTTKEVEKVIELLNKKIEVESKLAKADQLILELIELIEGIEVTEEGIKKNWLGSLSHKAYFVKKIILIDKITPTNLQINNIELFKEMKQEYVNVNKQIEVLIEQSNEVENAKAEYENIKQEYEILQHEYEAYKNENLSGNNDQKAYNKKRIQYESELLQLQISMNMWSESVDFHENTLKEITTELMTLNHGVKQKIEEALIKIDEINNLRIKAEGTLEELENDYNEAKKVISEDFYNELLEELQAAKEYTKEQDTQFGIIKNFATFEENLRYNNNLLEQIDNEELIYITVSQGDKRTQSILDLKKKYNKYKCQDLVFNYNGLDLNTKSNQIRKRMQALIKEGLISLVMDDNELSKKQIVHDNLPSQSALASEQNITEVDKILEAEKTSKIFELINDTLKASIFEGLSFEKDTIEAMASNFLFIQYLNSHFTNYKTEVNNSSHQLQYELEYILCGKEKDRDNVTSVISKIILMRTLINFVHVVTDKSKVKQAMMFASSVVGFTGLPYLISILKYITLFIWGFEQALIEVAAIVDGKKVPLITTKESFVVDFEELFSMTKEKIRKKANAYNEMTGRISFGYENYLYMFLYMAKSKKLSYRAMDLIQVNIQLEYDENFLVSNCLYGYQMTANLSMKQKFLTIPYLVYPEIKRQDKYKQQINNEVSY